MKKITICFPFFGQSLGGSDISTINLINGLDKNKFEIRVVLLSRGILEKYLAKNKIKFDYIELSFITKNNFFYFLVNILINFFKVLNYLKIQKVDIVHTNDNKTHQSFFLQAFILNIRHVLHFRNNDTSFRNKIIFFFSKKIITISKFSYNHIPFIFKKKTKTIKNPVFLKKEKSSSLFEFYRWKAKNNPKQIICFVGNYSERKRIEFFIDIAVNIIKKNKKIYFVILGEKREPYYSRCKKKIKNELKEYFNFLGFHFSIDHILAKSDLLVAPAINEPFGRVLIEGMLNKINIVASRSGAHTEVLKNGELGILANTDDKNDFVEKIIFALSIKNKQNLDKAKIYAENNYNQKSHCKKIENIYKSFF